MFHTPFNEGVVGRASKNGLIEIIIHDIRSYSKDPHKRVDDYPYGGGPGMLMRPEPLFDAIETAKTQSIMSPQTPIILMTPQGRRLNHKIVHELSCHDELSIICGRYEGFDERVRIELATDEISIGDFVISGGELAAMTVIDSITRLIPGVLGTSDSPTNDSFYEGLLQFPQFTRPPTYRNLTVPDILLSGNHSQINKWRRMQSLQRTAERRPELLENISLTEEEMDFIGDILTTEMQGSKKTTDS